MFEGFVEGMVDAGNVSLFVRYGGTGPVVLSLHGHPRTSSTWHEVAPRLVSEGLTVVCADLPGYGRSGKPESEPSHVPHSKRVGAQHVLAAMKSLGHSQFAVVGHDRGSYYAFRLALDYPKVLSKVALLDSLPIVEHLDRIDAHFATSWWHWFFYAQEEIPERVINADPEAWYCRDPEQMGQENYAEWQAAVHDPQVVRGMLEDYRAGLVIDADEERADKQNGHQLHKPLLAVWSSQDGLADLHGDPLSIWQEWATDVTGQSIDSGHHMAEQAPKQLAAVLASFLH